MWQQNEEIKNKMIHKVYVGILLLIVLVIIPIQELRRIFQYYHQYQTFLDVLRGNYYYQNQNTRDVVYLYPVLSRNPYKGTWKSSIKISNFLKEEQGSIQIRTILNQTEQANSYDLHIRIIDGLYRDNDYFDIVIYSGSLMVNQQYEKGKALYQTTSPLIGFYRKGHLLIKSEQQALYIKKLKFKILASYAADQQLIQSISMELLIYSQYQINIIGRDLVEYKETIHDMLLAILLMCQFGIQGFAIYKISEGIIQKKSCAQRYSKIGFLISTLLDMVQAIGLTILGAISTKKLAVFSLPILTIWAIIVGIQVRILTILFHKELKENALKFSAKIFAMLCVTCAITFYSNFSNFFLVGTTLVAIFPQIYNNYMVGHKLKDSMHNFLYYVIPRYSFIVHYNLIQPYLRIYEYNIFGIESDLTILLISTGIILFQISLLYLQIRYGPRSIVPNFLHVDELKYFLSLPDQEDGICSICLISLKQKSSVELVEINQFRQLGGEENFNSIVLTPCKHKFHIQCLFVAMKTKLECPYCRSVLPPLDE